MTQPVLGSVYSYPGNPRVFKAQIAALYNNTSISLIPDFEFGQTNKSADFLSKFPLGKVPAFEGVDGFSLYESAAIAFYAATNPSGPSPLLGVTPQEKAKVMQWIYLADNEFSPIAAAWLYPILGYSTNDFAALAKAKENAKRVLKVLDDHFLNCTFLVGDAVTLADISLACNLSMFYKMVFDPEFRASFKNVTRWFLTCVNQPHFLTVMGVSELCEKMSVAQVVKKVEKVEKAEKPKEEKPKEAKKPKKKDDDDEEPEEDFSDKKPEGKNPLDLLPPSATFNMDAWKRCYSNNETRPVATDFFWQNFDPAGYSIYKVSYKYNSELSLIFMSSNLIGGFFNRLESARKYAFGSLVVLGEDKNSVIQGFFVFRGVGIPFEVSDCPDFESYEFEKVDHTDKASRDAFDACIAWDKTIDGKPFADGKIFK